MQPLGLIPGAIFLCAGALYGALAALVLAQAPRNRTGWRFAAACLATAAWLLAQAMPLPPPRETWLGALEWLRSVTWFWFLLHVYRTSLSGRGPMTRGFAVAGGVVALAVAATLVAEHRGVALPAHMFSSSIALRIGMAVCTLLLIENLYRNTPEEQRWHINLVCIALAGIFVFDIAVAADVVLFRRATAVATIGRAIAAGLAAPLLALSLARNRRWDLRLHMSRTAAFHTATLIASGVVLLALAAVGEAFRFLGADWAGLVEVSLTFGGVLAIAVMLTSGSARSRLRRVLVDHFFSHRYDYRQEWMRSIDMLAGTDPLAPLHGRVIRAVANVVDSPAGLLLLRGERGFTWAASWNAPVPDALLPEDHALVGALGQAPAVVLGGALRPDWLEGAWLAVGLTHAGQLLGVAVVMPPRAAFTLDAEVFALLGLIGRQAAAYLAEHQAAATLIEAQALHDFGKRFAFVAHDIKNVSSQLSMLLANAELHLSNPEFQRDMLATVRASVQRISGLLRKLQAPDPDAVPPAIEPGERLRALIAASPRLRTAALALGAPERGLAVRMPAAAFDAIATHLLDNALDAMAERPAGGVVGITLRREARQVVLDISDTGPGMSAEFVRDRLFRPFDTSKPAGSGIGAWQARELARGAGGDLMALSEPGRGTTMRVILPAADGRLAGAA